MARDSGHFQGARGRLLDQLLEKSEDIMAGTEEDGPALLHGDLWTGNYFAGPAGSPVLIDPAVYVGAGEVDLAMMELFGSFPAGFEEAYGSVRKLAPEYAAFRRDLYQIYYLLVHVNLFGSSYVSGTLGAAQRVVGRDLSRSFRASARGAYHPLTVSANRRIPFSSNSSEVA